MSNLLICRKNTDLIFGKDILNNLHNIELSIEKLKEKGLMKTAYLKHIKNFKQNNNFNINKNDFSKNLNFTYMKKIENGNYY